MNTRKTYTVYTVEQVVDEDGKVKTQQHADFPSYAEYDQAVKAARILLRRGHSVVKVNEELITRTERTSNA